MKKQNKTLGIIGLSVGWLIPIAAIILGIIGLSIGENKTLSIISIAEGALFWLLWTLFYLGY